MSAIKNLSLGFFLLASPVFSQTTTEHVVRFSGSLGELRLSADDLRAGLMGSGSDTRRIAIAMDEDSTAAFLFFTRTHVNQNVSFVVCGQEMQSITVQAPIDSGFALTDQLPLDQATAIVAALNGEGDCP